MKAKELAQQFIAAAAWLNEHPDLDIWGGATLDIYLNTKEELQQHVKELGGHWDKVDEFNTIFVMRQMLPHGAYIDLNIGREQVCERIVVGTKHVEEQHIQEQTIPAHYEDIVKWKCHSILEETED